MTEERTPGHLAEAAIEMAAQDGYALPLRPDTPVIPDELAWWLSERTTWVDIDGLRRRLADVGCTWVNLRFSLDAHGAIVRYEARPDGESRDRLPDCNGGFDPPAWPALANHAVVSVVVGPNPLGLPVGMLVQEVSRREVWDHHGCIASVRTVLIELRLPDGQVRSTVLEQDLAQSGAGSNESWLRPT